MNGVARWTGRRRIGPAGLARPVAEPQWHNTGQSLPRGVVFRRIRRTNPAAGAAPSDPRIAGDAGVTQLVECRIPKTASFVAVAPLNARQPRKSRQKALIATQASG